MRVYTETEVQELLRRASALQAAAPARHGLTLDEIQKAAEAAGIDPAFVSAAAAQPVPTSSMTTEPGRGFWGGPFTISLERTVRGTFDDDAWAEIVGELRRAYATTGTVSEAGSMRDWTNGMMASGTSYFYQRLSATPRRGQTTLLIEHKMHNESAMYILPMFAAIGMIPTAILAAVGKTSILPFLLFTLAFVATFALTRHLYASATRKASRKAADVLDRIDQRLDDLRAEVGGEAVPDAVSPAVPAPALSLPTDEAPDTTASVPASSRLSGRV